MFKKNKRSVTNEYLTTLNQSDENIANYSKFGIDGTNFLAFRDLSSLINKYAKGKKTLDFGCGAGRSTRFLKSLGLDVVGVDISEKFLQVCKDDEEIHYCKIENNKLPYVDNSYDLVFSSLVFLAIPTKQDIVTALREIYRVLKKTGVLIIVTGTEKLHSPEMQWISYDTKFPENQNPISGKVLKLFIKKANVTFYDYFWSNKDYLELFSLCNFQILETHLPLGNKEDGYLWISEKENAPFVIYMLKKKYN